jgi:hypothetical protein
MRNFIQRLLKDENGSIAVESVVIFPLLIWAYMAFFVYFDAYRSQSMAMKASYAIADVFSRRTDYVTANYMDGIEQLHELMTRSPEPTRLLLTVFTFNAEEEQYNVVWSEGEGGVIPMTTEVLNTLSTQLPAIPSGERMILLQTWSEYEPVFQVGLADTTLNSFVVIRPRYAPQLCWNTVEGGDAGTAIC